MPERDLTRADRDELKVRRTRIETLIAPSEQGGGIDPRAAASMSDDDLVNALAQYLDLEAIETTGAARAARPFRNEPARSSNCSR